MKDEKTMIEKVRALLPWRDALEQLAEEAAELAQAALKEIRAEHLNRNPTPLSAKQARENLQEEADDVMMLLELFGLVETIDTSENPKWERWLERLQNRPNMDDYIIREEVNPHAAN